MVLENKGAKEMEMGEETEKLQAKPICVWTQWEKLLFLDFVNKANQQGHTVKIEGEACFYCGENKADTELYLEGFGVSGTGVIVPSCNQCTRQAELNHICRSRRN